MTSYFSCRMSLDEMTVNPKYEQVVVENIKRCKKLTGKSFKLILWNKNLSSKKVKEFVDRNEKDLFDINTQITKRFSSGCWFLIDGLGEDKSRFRFKWPGDILDGLVQYIKLLKNTKGLMNESSNRR